MPMSLLQRHLNINLFPETKKRVLVRQRRFAHITLKTIAALRRTAYPSVPFYNLPECHRKMTPQGILANTEVRKLAETRAMIAVDPPGIG